MAFSLDDVVPWGRSYEEYVAMFRLTPKDMSKHILGCGDGPASFNAEATRRGSHVISVDPIYAFTPDEIQRRIDVTASTIADQLRRNAAQFVWSHFASPDAVVNTRIAAMRRFLDDLPQGARQGRYVAGGLPALPFEAQAFDLALCSHFLFLYSAQHDIDFHLESIIELARIAREVRVFPLLDLAGAPSVHIVPVVEQLRSNGATVETVRVPYEFQQGGNTMLRVIPGRPSQPPA
jgi:hypothetical protein